MVEIARYARSLQLKDLINLNVGEPDFDTPQHVRDAAIKAIQEGRTHYTQSEGLQELRVAISEKLRTQNSLDYPPDQITVVSGTQEGISVISETIFAPGDEVLVTDPFFPAYVQNVALQGSKVVPVPLREEDRYHVVSEEGLRGLVTPKTKALILISPNNPTGAVQGIDSLKIISEVAQASDLLVISDEIYENITYGPKNNHVSIGSLPGMSERTITQNGFSKSYAMTGWRVGYFAAPPEVSMKLQQVHRGTAICPPSISQYAALAALNGPQQCVSEMTSEFAKRKDLIVRMLREIPNVSVPEPEGAFYVFPNFRHYTEDDEELARELIREAHVVTLPGSSFGLQGRGHLRMSYATSRDKIEQGITRIREYLLRGGKNRTV